MVGDDVRDDGPVEESSASSSSADSAPAEVPSGDVTQILRAIEEGNGQAAEELLPLVYEELRRLASVLMARERPGQTLQATALVHDAYLRLVDEKQTGHWNSEGHFFCAAAEAMRRILVDRAREKGRVKRGGDRIRLDLDHLEIGVNDSQGEALLLDETLTQLAREDPQAAHLLELRFFAGLTMEQAAAVMGLSRRTAYRCWALARAWLYGQLANDANNTDSGYI